MNTKARLNNQELLKKLKKLGWTSDSDMYVDTMSESLEAITHEIAHIVTVDECIQPLTQTQVGNLLKQKLRTRKDEDDNEFLTSAVTLEVMHRLGVSIQHTIIENLSLNIHDIGSKERGIKFTGRSQRYQYLLDQCLELIKQQATQVHVDKVMEYYTCVGKLGLT